MAMGFKMTRRGIRRLSHLCGALLLMSTVATSAAVAETHVISQKNKMFSAKEITIAVGDEIEFHNFDDTAHSILSLTPGMEFDLKTQRQNEVKKHTFTKPGRLEIGCDIHLKMSLIVNVQ